MIFPSVLLTFFFIITGIDFGYSLYSRYWVKTFEPIGYMAHFGGALCGLLMGICILKNFKYSEREKYFWWTSFALYGVLMIIMIALNIFWIDYFK